MAALTDDPKKKIEEDEFGRTEFIQFIADYIKTQITVSNDGTPPPILQSEESLVIGLYGPWGYGKSTCLYMIDDAMGEGKGFQTLFFNPWIYRSEDELIVSLFDLFIKQFKPKDTTRGELQTTLKKYYKLIGLFGSNFRNATEVIEDHFKENEPEKDAIYYKDLIQTYLNSLANPLVIFIDDVDRLSKNEVHVLFKTIRLIASFQNVVYVLAFDFDMVSKSIKEHYADGSIEDGRNFIEKIVQIPIRIPEINAEQLTKYASECLGKVVKQNFHENSLFRELIEYYYSTPREIKRFVNSYLVKYFLLANRIDPIELACLELIMLKDDLIAEIIETYYYAQKARDVDGHLKREIEFLLKERRPNYFLAGKFSPSGAEYQFERKILLNLFLLDIRASQLSYDGRNMDFHTYRKEISASNIPKSKLRNPELLLHYFELTT